VSDNPSKTLAGRGRKPGDRRDEVVGATLVGLVVVLLGYASGIGAGGSGGSWSSIAAGGTAPSVPGSSAAPASATSPVLIQASTSPNGSSAWNPGLADSTGPTSAKPTSAPSASVGPSPSSVASSALPTTPTPTSPPTVIGSQSQTPEPTDSTTSEPSPSGQPSTSPSVPVSSGLLLGLLPPDLLPCLLGPVNSLLGLGNLLGPCQPAPSSASGTP
jgi:hypothetical protein